MDDVKLDGPTDILITLGLTLPSISEAELADIRAAAPPSSTVRVASTMDEAIATAGDAEVILGFIPRPLFDAAPELRWVHCIASGMDMFLYPDMRASSVVLTGEKGLVGGHLADTGFGLLLALTRQIATAIRLGADGWNQREAMRRVEIELEGLTMGVVGFGGTGRALARRAVAFGMDALACDVASVPASDGVLEVWPMDRLHDLLGASDVVAVGTPLTSETRGLFDDERFAAMRPGGCVVRERDARGDRRRWRDRGRAAQRAPQRRGPRRGADRATAPRSPAVDVRQRGDDATHGRGLATARSPEHPPVLREPAPGPDRRRAARRGRQGVGVLTIEEKTMRYYSCDSHVVEPASVFDGFEREFGSARRGSRRFLTTASSSCSRRLAASRSVGSASPAIDSTTRRRTPSSLGATQG